MSEVVQTEQPEQQQTTDVSPEDRMARAAGLDTAPPPIDKARDDKGRFAKPETQAAEAPPTEETTEATTEAAEEQPEYKWDEVKQIKLKIPMKNGDKEWEDELTLEELRNQRMMHADYMARRKEIDTERATFDTKLKERVDTERTHYLGALTVLQQTVMQAAAQELANVDWQKLAAEDPASYVRLQARAHQLGSAFQSIATEQEKVQRQQESEKLEKLSKAVQESRTKLKEAIPNWSDDLYAAVLKRAGEYGFKGEEVGAVDDPAKIQPVYPYDDRFVKLLHDAHQYRLITEGKSTAEKKVAGAAPVLKPGAVKPKVNPQVQQFHKAKERLKADPRSDEAATDLMRAFIR